MRSDGLPISSRTLRVGTNPSIGDTIKGRSLAASTVARLDVSTGNLAVDSWLVDSGNSASVLIISSVWLEQFQQI